MTFPDPLEHYDIGAIIDVLGKGCARKNGEPGTESDVVKALIAAYYETIANDTKKQVWEEIEEAAAAQASHDLGRPASETEIRSFVMQIGSFVYHKDIKRWFHGDNRVDSVAAVAKVLTALRLEAPNFPELRRQFLSGIFGAFGWLLRNLGQQISSREISNCVVDLYPLLLSRDDWYSLSPSELAEWFNEERINRHANKADRLSAEQVAEARLLLVYYEILIDLLPLERQTLTLESMKNHSI